MGWFRATVDWAGWPARNSGSPSGSDVGNESTRHHGLQVPELPNGDRANRVLGWDFYDPERGRAIVADGVVDNEDELRAILKRPVAAGLPHLLAAGFERWGSDLPKHLAGDFAFAIWDTRRQSVFAARDPFGVRSLVYHEMPGRLLLASDPEQLRGEIPCSNAPDEVTILEYLVWDYRELGRTFFRSIRRLPAGHTLQAGEKALQLTRYWEPPSQSIKLPNTEAYHEEFRRLFFQSVRDRLKNAGPALIHLSGGVDSSSIVCVADALVQRGEARDVRAVSAVFPGLSCDESPFIDAVKRTVRIPCESWNGTQASNADLDDPDRVWPAGRTSFAGGTNGDLDLAHRCGATTILGGSGGDEIGSSDGILRDLGNHHQWMYLLEEIALARPGTLRSKASTFVDSVAGLAPPWTRRAYRRLRPPSPRSAMRHVWLAPRLADLAQERGACSSNDGHMFLSNLQRRKWISLCSAALGWSIERQQRLAATRQIAMRFPFLDARLAQFALAIPYENWALGGYPERLHRTAFSALLPREILARRTKSHFGSALSLRLRTAAAVVAQLLERGEWASADYVNRQEAKSLLARCNSLDVVPFWDRYYLWQIATLEAWLRGLG